VGAADVARTVCGLLLPIMKPIVVRSVRLNFPLPTIRKAVLGLSVVVRFVYILHPISRRFNGMTMEKPI